MTRGPRRLALVLAATVLGMAAASPVAAGPRPGEDPFAARETAAGPPAAGADVVTRLEGEDRYATSVAIARDAHGGQAGEPGASAAVLARGDDFADALAGVPLAHHLDAPVLLTRPGALPDVTRRGLQDLLAPEATVHVLGGEVAVSEDVVITLRAAGWTVRRHAGATRYGTAAAIASALPPSDLAYLASGATPADALAAAPVAARRGAPVLLTEPAGLPEATATALAGIEKVVLVGGPGAVAEPVGEGLRADHEVVRVAGPDRFATAVAVARHGAGEPTAVSLASGGAWPDALTGAAHAAATGSVLLLSDHDRLTWPTAEQVTRLSSLPVRVYGGPVAVAPVVERDVRLARASDPDAPVPTGLAPGRRVEAGSDLRVTFSHAPARSELDVVPDASATPRLDGTAVVVPLPGTDGTDLDVSVEGSVADADGRTRWFREPVTVVAPATHTVSPEGFRVASGTGPVVGTTGPLVTWTVEVEPATGRPLDQVLPVVTAALTDPDRGWTARGAWRLQRVADPSAADIRVVLAMPATVDAHCARIGVTTAGIFSCWDGERTMLNLTRWDHGATDFDRLDRYRTYLVNHEVGHGLGYGHVEACAAGTLAPVMMQQTKTVGTCLPNGWPHP